MRQKLTSRTRARVESHARESRQCDASRRGARTSRTRVASTVRPERVFAEVGESDASAAACDGAARHYCRRWFFCWYASFFVFWGFFWGVVLGVRSWCRYWIFLNVDLRFECGFFRRWKFVFFLLYILFEIFFMNFIVVRFWIS